MFALKQSRPRLSEKNFLIKLYEETACIFMIFFLKYEESLDPLHPPTPPAHLGLDHCTTGSHVNASTLLLFMGGVLVQLKKMKYLC